MNVRERFEELVAKELDKFVKDGLAARRGIVDGDQLYSGIVEQVVAEAVAEEREQCALLAESLAVTHLLHHPEKYHAADAVAHAIRAKRNT